ncbi:protein TALPID3 isoform X2 [Heterodontus francisci]|uniref:protein TALPID3 isoform X2 n=1 Tax=Heterodontus francisci TaxID=7792 RepID=UPI00355B6BCE
MEFPVNVMEGDGDCHPGTASRVRISVQKLRKVTSDGAEDSFYIPPALPVNKPRGDMFASDADVSGGAFPKAHVHDLFGTKSTGQQIQKETNYDYCRLLQWCSSLNHEHATAAHLPTEPADGSRHEGNDILISQYTRGQKEAMKAIVKRKVQSGPIGKKVKVQLLRKSSVEDKESFTQDAGETQYDLNSVTTTAAATAAAIAATAPLLKAQSDLEAKLATVAELGTKLQEMDQQMKQVVEQQAKVLAQDPRPKEHQERIRELETQLSTLLNQRLCHLEKLQEQQLKLQSRMLTSAFTTSNIHPVEAPPVHSDKMTQSSAPHCNATQTLNQGLQQLPSNNIHYVSLRDVPSDSSAAALACRSQPGTGGIGMGSSLQTPAPRRFAPVPMSKDIQVQKKMKSAIQKAKANAVIAVDGQGNMNFLEAILNNQETPASKTNAVEKTGVAMTTAGRHPDRSSSGNPLNESFTAFVVPSRGSGSAVSKASPAVQKASDVLHDLGRLKREMHGILQEAEHWQSRMQDMKSVSANQSNSHKSIDSAPLQHHLLKQPICIAKETNPSHSQKPSLIQSVKAPKSMFEDAGRILREVQTNKKFIEENLEAIVRAKDSASMYSLIDSLAANSDAAEKIRIGKTVDAWITVINQDIQDEIAKKKISSKQKEQELSFMRKGGDVKAIKFDKDVKDKTQNKPESTTKRSLSTARSLQKQLKEPCESKILRSKAVIQSLQQKEQRSKISVDLDRIISTDPLLQSEDYLRRVYGKAVYQGHRSTYKKGPYLRVNSPVPKSKPQRPKMIENIKGVKVKSTRTQTTPFALKTTIANPERERHISVPTFQDNQYMFSPSHQITSTSLISGPVEGHLIPMAIALGEPRIDGGVPQAAGLIINSAHPITVPTSVHPSPLKPQPQVKKPNIAVVHMKSEKKDPIKLTVQVLPNVDIDSLASNSPAASQRSINPKQQQQIMHHPAQTLIQSQEAVQTEEEDGTGFPGASYIAIADLSKDAESDDELQGSPEPGIELDGFAEYISVSYNGPPFPPCAPAPQPAVDIADKRIKHKESIENQLIKWVEQELMSRIISEMYPVQQQPVPHVSQCEGEESVLSGSDIVEAAGEGGFQLFVDAGVPVDSQMVRQFVDEALAEIIAIMLGQRQSESRTPLQELPQRETPSPTILIPTPDPTPRHTPSPPARAPSLIQTPDVTPQDSVAATEEKESESEPELESLLKPLPVINAAGMEAPGKTSPVGTPVITPIPTPSRVSTPSPVTGPISEKIKSTSSAPSQQLPNPWGDAELPLEEENPRSVLEAAPLPRAIVMSVAKDEEPVSLVLPPNAVIPILPTLPPCPVPHVQTPTPPVRSLTPLPSTEESSSTISVTETETADRNISEGEILISYGQMAAAKVLKEEGISFPNFNDSLSSTLQDAQEMDDDPPSEGQVISKQHKGLQKYSLGTMLAKVLQGPYAPQEIHHPENSDDDSSTGQISEGQMPRLTAAAESILTGQSQYINPSSMNRGTNLPQRRHSTSPGQFGIHTERNGREFDASYGPMTLADLEIWPVPALHTSRVTGTAQKTPMAENMGQGDDISTTEQKPATARVIKVESITKDPIQPSTKAERSSEFQATPLKMSVTLPSMNEEDQSGSISTIDGDDTSGAEIF